MDLGFDVRVRVLVECQCEFHALGLWPPFCLVYSACLPPARTILESLSSTQLRIILSYKPAS